MTLEDYFKMIHKAPAITRRQANLLRIPYPLVKGWYDINKYKDIGDPYKFFDLSSKQTKCKKGLAPKQKGWKKNRRVPSKITPNGMAELLGEEFVKSHAFYLCKEWKALRYTVLNESDGRCECCGASKKDGAVLHVDHIYPRSKYWRLALNKENLQVLCDLCNTGKSNNDTRD